MKLPFHGVQVCGGVLFAVKGGAIHSFQLADGSHVSSWRYTGPARDEEPPPAATAAAGGKTKLVIDVSEQSTPTPAEEDQGPPAKRVKLEDGGATPGEAAAVEDGGAHVKQTGGEAGVEGNGEQGKGKGKKNKKQLLRAGALSQSSERPMVILTTATKDGCYLVAVTSDKSIWVFEHDGQGHLKQLSCRTMPKRPCSVVLTPENKDILAADKFGDVYSLPLIPSEDPATAPAQPQPADREENSPAPAAPAAPVFRPQATELTVHTKRNRQALIDQQLSRTNPKALRGSPRRVDAVFERHLLLGHVSLLTAVALAHDEQGRPYILTADRDEHMRVSRGTRAQAHVIEAFCLGHEHFVTRICIPEGAGGSSMGQLLVSAGGDDDVFVWRWREGRLLARTDLLGAVKGVVPEATKLAVTGLCCWSEGSEDRKETRIVVVCERVPALFLFILQDTGSLEISRTIRLPGNPLEVGVVDGTNLVVAVEPIHETGDYDVFKSLLKVEHVNGEYQISEGLVKDVPEVSNEDSDVSAEELKRLLYSAETLRKLDVEEADGNAE